MQSHSTTAMGGVAGAIAVVKASMQRRNARRRNGSQARRVAEKAPFAARGTAAQIRAWGWEACLAAQLGGVALNETGPTIQLRPSVWLEVLSRGLACRAASGGVGSGGARLLEDAFAGLVDLFEVEA